MASLLAIDIGLKTGFALYGGEGKLKRYWSRRLGDRSKLKRIAFSTLKEPEDLEWLILEGGGWVAEIWRKEGARRGLKVRDVCAEEWRKDFFYPRQMRTGVEAKRNAVKLARKTIQWSGLNKPTSLKRDAAEAILIGLWGAIQLKLVSHEVIPEILLI